jgi:hypothetical protein
MLFKLKIYQNIIFQCCYQLKYLQEHISGLTFDIVLPQMLMIKDKASFDSREQRIQEDSVI